MTELVASGPPASRRVLVGYFTLAGLYTLSAAAIWGVNTLFLLDAGLSFFEVFVANAAFSAGMVHLRGADRGRGGHARAARLLPVLGVGARGDDADVRRPRRGRRGCRRVLRRLGRDGPRVHLLLRRDGGLARRRADGHGLRARARRRLRAGPAGHRRRDARRHGRRRASRADRPVAALPGAVGPSRCGVRHRLRRDARPRLHAASRAARRAAARDRPERASGGAVRLGGASAPPVDARLARSRWGS